MKTTMELPDELMRTVKVRAAQSDRSIKDIVTELIERGLASTDDHQDPLQAWLQSLVFNPDGTVTNPGGIHDAAFFEALEHSRAENRQQVPRDPFASQN